MSRGQGTSTCSVCASSGAVGLAAARLLPAPAAAAAFCGSFAGMCGSGVAASGAEILFLGVFCATAQNVCAASLPGVGGRLGVVALGSTLCWQATKTLLSHGPLLSFVPQHLAWHVLAWQLPAAALLSTAAALGVKKLSQTQGIVFSAGAAGVLATQRFPPTARLWPAGPSASAACDSHDHVLRSPA